MGLLGLPFGGRVRVRRNAVECYGGAVKWLLHRMSHGQFTLGLTLGHSILGPTDAALDICRDHEHVHVRQFERWGPFMGPAYGIASLIAWIRGGNPYRDNCFEREAYDADPERRFND